MGWEGQNQQEGKAKQRAPDVMVTKIILVALFHFLQFQWLMQHSFFFWLNSYVLALKFVSKPQGMLTLYHTWQKDLR